MKDTMHNSIVDVVIRYCNIIYIHYGNTIKLLNIIMFFQQYKLYYINQFTIVNTTHHATAKFAN